MTREKERRAQMIEAAATLFPKFGFSKTTLEDIAGQCGVGKTALYYYFRNKNDLLLETIRVINEQILDEIRRAVDEVEGEKEQVVTFLAVASEAVMSRLVPIMPSPEQVVDVVPQIQEIWTGFTEREIQILASILERGKRRGVFSVDNPRVVAMAMVIGFHALQHWLSLTQDTSPARDVKEELLRLLMHGICP